MKDGRTHLAHKAEHAVDMDSGAILAVTINPGAAGDTTTIHETMVETTLNLAGLQQRGEERGLRSRPEST